jgi:hypothetical protein
VIAVILASPIGLAVAGKGHVVVTSDDPYRAMMVGYSDQTRRYVLLSSEADKAPEQLMKYADRACGGAAPCEVIFWNRADLVPSAPSLSSESEKGIVARIHRRADGSYHEGALERSQPLPSDSGEPFGLVLTKASAGSSNRSARLHWGMPRSEVDELLQAPGGGRSPLNCSGSRLVMCFVLDPSVYSTWSADFGGVRTDPILEFTPDGRFFAFHLSFSEDAYLTVSRSLDSRLGAATLAEDSEVQNRMGATFNQTISTWANTHTSVFLIRRSPSDLTKSTVRVAYLPLEGTLPPEPTAPAPF